MRGREIHTPILWVSYELFNPPNLWKHVKHVEGLLINVHNLNQRRDIVAMLKQGKDFKEIIDFDGALMLDCGGVKFLGKNQGYSLHRVLSLCRQVSPDIVVGADYPISPDRSRDENEKRQKKTLGNLKEIVREVNFDCQLLPVIHGYTYSDVNKMINHIKKISEKIRCYGIGSLVPLLVPFTVEKYKRIVDIIVHVRRKMPDIFLHVFGMGSVLTMHIALLLGVDSLDSQAWVRSAGYGKIQIAGKGQRFVKRNEKRFKYSQWSRQVDWDSFKCNCSICTRRDFKEMLLVSKKNRAIHNAHVFCSEARLARKLIEKGEYLSFVRERIRNTSLWPLFKYVENEVLRKT